MMQYFQLILTHNEIISFSFLICAHVGLPDVCIGECGQHENLNMEKKIYALENIDNRKVQIILKYLNSADLS